MDFRQEIFDFVESNSIEQTELIGNEIRIPKEDVRFKIKSITKEQDNVQNSGRIIWEDQWAKKRSIVESRILSVLGKSKRIYGRDTVIRKLIQPETNSFLKENHLIGTTSAKTKLGLVHKDKIMAIATFSKPTKMNRGGIVFRSYEMIRYCTLNGFTVVGGLSKLINHFIKLEKPDDIMTSVDREWSEGKSFEKLGFKMIEVTPPREFYLDPVGMERYRTAQEAPPNSISIKNGGNYKFILFLK